MVLLVPSYQDTGAVTYERVAQARSCFCVRNVKRLTWVDVRPWAGPPVSRAGCPPGGPGISVALNQILKGRISRNSGNSRPLISISR